jgi:microcystin-dependent protein
LGINQYAPASGGQTRQLADIALPPAGSSFPHNNIQPFLTLNFCIALEGDFPPPP